jgi:hypothetical protein
MSATVDMFAPLTEQETLTLMSMLRHGYKASREAYAAIRVKYPRGFKSMPSDAKQLVSASRGSLAAVRADLTWVSSALLNHYRILEREQ